MSQLIQGWGAPPLKEQFPQLSDSIAEAFDADNQAISRLVIRGVITHGESTKARARLTKGVQAAINTLHKEQS